MLDVTRLFDPFQAPYMQRALLAVVMLGVLAGVVGVAVVLRRLAFYGDALTHTVFPGIAIAHLVGQSLFLGALVLALLAAVLLTAIGARRRVGQDAALAIVLTACFSVGVVLVSRQDSFASDLTAFLFGQLLTVTAANLLQTLAVAVVVLVTLTALRKELLLRAFDPDAAAALGYNLRALDVVLNACVALVVVAALQAVGTMLALAYLIVPAAAARLVTGRLAAMLAVSVGIGVLGGWVGLLISYETSITYDLRLAPGATVVTTLVVAFLICLALGPGWRRLRRARVRARPTTAPPTHVSGGAHGGALVKVAQPVVHRTHGPGAGAHG
jgi:manganese/iron transport system permease protein